MAFLTMEVAARCYVICETRLVERSPCNSAGFFAWSNPSLRDPERPREAPNLSPEPSPKGTRACSPRWQQSVPGIPPGRLSSAVVGGPSGKAG
jgi:hypothetical protein